MLRRQDGACSSELHPSRPQGAQPGIQPGHQPQGDASRRLDGAHALIPPKEKRGLVLIDPPYEEPMNSIASARNLRSDAEMAERRVMRPGIRSRRRCRSTTWWLGFTRRARARVCAIEMLIDDPRDRLASTGAAFGAEPALRPSGRGRALLPALAERLSRGPTRRLPVRDFRAARLVSRASKVAMAMRALHEGALSLSGISHADASLFPGIALRSQDQDCRLSLLDLIDRIEIVDADTSKP